MESEERFMQKRIHDLSERSYRNNQYTFTGFLGIREQDLFYRMLPELSAIEWMLFGGADGCERQVLRFGGLESLGYEEEFPVCCIAVRPLQTRFSDSLNHRDYLGALMNLGIERSTVGDIIQKENVAYLFCMNQIVDYIIDNLTQIKHTRVTCSVQTEILEAVRPTLEDCSLVVSSLRADGVVAKLYHLSRSQSLSLFRGKRIAVNGKIVENNSAVLKQGDIVSVRGYGKFICNGSSRRTKKGNLGVEISRYI